MRKTIVHMVKDRGTACGSRLVLAPGRTTEDPSAVTCARCKERMRGGERILPRMPEGGRL